MVYFLNWFQHFVKAEQTKGTSVMSNWRMFSKSLFCKKKIRLEQCFWRVLSAGQQDAKPAWVQNTGAENIQIQNVASKVHKETKPNSDFVFACL